MSETTVSGGLSERKETKISTELVLPLVSCHFVVFVCSFGWCCAPSPSPPPLPSLPPMFYYYVLSVVRVYHSTVQTLHSLVPTYNKYGVYKHLIPAHRSDIEMCSAALPCIGGLCAFVERVSYEIVPHHVCHGIGATCFFFFSFYVFILGSSCAVGSLYIIYIYKYMEKHVCARGIYVLVYIHNNIQMLQ